MKKKSDHLWQIDSSSIGYSWDEFFLFQTDRKVLIALLQIVWIFMNIHDSLNQTQDNTVSKADSTKKN